MRDFNLYKTKQGKYAAEFLNPYTGLRMCYRVLGTAADQVFSKILQFPKAV